MSPENINHIDSDARRALFHFCNTLIHMDDNLCTVALLRHTTQVITKEEGGCSIWHTDGPGPKKKTAHDGTGKPISQVTDYNHPSTKQECTQRGLFCRSISVCICITGEKKRSR
jgi:hypothetical protein